MMQPITPRLAPAALAPTAAPAVDARPGAAEEAAQAFLDAFEPSGAAAVSESTDPERGAKEALLRGMIRKSPDDESTRKVVEALCTYPLKAIQTVSDYGTRIELFDFDAGDPVPEYLPTLEYREVAGAYNTKANVLGFDRKNIDHFAALHEFAHALDAALCEPSASPEWRNAHAFAKNTNNTVRDYAKTDPSEYLAENTMAYLVADERLPDLVDQGLAGGALGLDDRQYMQMSANLSNGRLHRMDPEGWTLVDDLLHKRLEDGPRSAPHPAMTAEEWSAFKAQQDAARG